MPHNDKCQACGNATSHSRHCGVQVCDACDHHNGLVRCYCGWASDGGDGYQELAELGENIEPGE